MQDAGAYAGQFRQALQGGDVQELWKLWAFVSPHLPGPKTFAQAEIIMHRARTEAGCVDLKCRAYSHAWLTERDLPSGLPDHLKPSAERLYPRIAKAVGIAVKMAPAFRDVQNEVQSAMSDAVEILHADGVDLDNRPLVHGYMFEAREKAMKRTLGRRV